MSINFFFMGLTPALALVVCLSLEPLILHFAVKHGYYDKPDARKIHKTPIPRLGGIGVFWGFSAAYAVLLLISKGFTGSYLFPTLAEGMAFSLALVIIHFSGLLDDFKDIRARYKLLAQISAAVILVSCGFSFRSLTIPVVGSFSLSWFGPVLTLVWYIGIINAVNLIDGMDGLSGSTVLVGTLFSAAYGFKLGYPLLVFFSLAAAGAVLAFLFFNFPPANIFMGDSGSLFLGLVAGTLPLLDPASRADGMALPLGITVFFVPLMDTLSAIIRRVREKRSIQSADKEHIHHKILSLGLNTRETLSTIVILEIVLSFSTIVHVYNRSWKGLPVYAAWLAGIIVFSVLHFQSKAKRSRE